VFNLFRRAREHDAAEWFGRDYWPHRPDTGNLRRDRDQLSILAGESSVAERRG
jgi:hypothetical protein